MTGAQPEDLLSHFSCEELAEVVQAFTGQFAVIFY